ncbi:MAG: hypothetical protein A2X95_07690 [Syntrophobacterales bacterium GWF2_56_9]|nr:MAG: hypothetical protein A2X95_07690 [Syntrophobacterales bacterium GWF2_56_9]
MKEVNTSIENKVVLSVQVFLLIGFYIFAAGVFTFLWYAVYRSVVDSDHPVHAVILASVITFAFLILVSVVTMVFTVVIKEGQKKVSENGGSVHEGEM